MNILLWILQILLSIHTAIGAVWKFSNSEQTVPSLSAIPHGVWQAASVLELFCSVGLILTFNKRLAIATPIAAVVIGLEMLLFCVLHIASGDRNPGPLMYWLVVAAVCAWIAYGRLLSRPVKEPIVKLG